MSTGPGRKIALSMSETGGTAAKSPESIFGEEPCSHVISLDRYCYSNMSRLDITCACI